MPSVFPDLLHIHVDDLLRAHWIFFLQTGGGSQRQGMHPNVAAQVVGDKLVLVSFSPSYLISSSGLPESFSFVRIRFSFTSLTRFPRQNT